MITEKFANMYGYSDVSPYEIVRQISDKTLEVRGMNAVLQESFKPEWIPGGFAGHCVNQSEQKYDYSSDETRQVIRIRKNKRGEWKSAGGSKFYLADTPRKFYDYNF